MADSSRTSAASHRDQPASEMPADDARWRVLVSIAMAVAQQPTSALGCPQEIADGAGGECGLREEHVMRADDLDRLAVRHI
jgi:hypothetical protein